MASLFDSDYTFKFGDDKVVITCEGKPNAVEQIKELARYILSLDSYQLEQEINDGKENPQAIISRLQLYMKDCLKRETDEQNIKTLKEGLFLSGSKENE